MSEGKFAIVFLLLGVFLIGFKFTGNVILSNFGVQLTSIIGALFFVLGILFGMVHVRGKKSSKSLEAIREKEIMEEAIREKEIRDNPLCRIAMEEAIRQKEILNEDTKNPLILDASDKTLINKLALSYLRNYDKSVNDLKDIDYLDAFSRAVDVVVDNYKEPYSK